MKAYIYDDNFEFKCEEETLAGITFINSTYKAPDLEKYPQDKYKIVFNKELDEWEYHLISKQESEPENQENPELTKKLTELYRLQDKYYTYYDTEVAARLLNLPQTIRPKRLAIKDKIAKLESEIKELKDGQN